MIETSLGIVALIILISGLGRLIKLFNYGLDTLIFVLKIDNKKELKK